MENLLNLHTLLELMLAISLSAASGFRVFVPLLALSGASVLGHVDLPTNFDWIESSQALIVFAIATVLEAGGYFIPGLDHLMDIVLKPAAIVAGTIVTASLVPDMNPVAQWVLALAVGGTTAGITGSLANILRLSSLALSAGLANPVVAAIELGLAILISVLAITVPAVAMLLLIGFLVFAITKLQTLVSAGLVRFGWFNSRKTLEPGGDA